MSGFAGSGWGEGPWGGSTLDDVSSGSTIDVVSGDTLTITDSYSVPLRVQDAVGTTKFSVRVDFSQDLDITYPALSLTSNYTIPGLTVLSVTILSLSQVLLATTPAQLPIIYTVTVGDAVSLNGDILGVDDHADFNGFILIPTFLAGAESSTKVELIFSTAMTVNSALTSTASYKIQATDGDAIIPILSAAVSGPLPRQRVTLILGTPLTSKQYYAVTVANTVTDVLGLNVVPNMYIMQWADMTQPVFIAPLEIPVKDFSGEIHGGLLGNPDGQVFFSPAFETVGATSTIELEQLSVCTKAYDEYTIPAPPDPIPLMTFSPGSQSVIGPSTVLWAPAWRLGQVQMTLGRNEVDQIQSANDGPVYGTLVETIDITRASFLNDSRWSTFPGSIAFRTADNKTSIGPGPTSLRTLDWPKIVIGDEIDIDDDVNLRSGLDPLLNDVISVSDVVTTGVLAVDIEDVVNVSDVLTPTTQYVRFANDSVFTTDVAETAIQTYNIIASDAIDISSDSISRTTFQVFSVATNDTVSTSDSISLTTSRVFSVVANDTVSTSDSITIGSVIDIFMLDSVSITDSITIVSHGIIDKSGSDSISITDSTISDNGLVSQVLQVSGNKLVNSQGQTVILRGFSFSSTETRPVQTSTFYEPIAPTIAGLGARAGANFMRIPLNQAAWLGTVTNAGISGAPYRSAIVNLVAQVRAYGLYALVDLHWNDPQPTASFTPNAAAQQVMANRDATGGTTDSRAFWTSVANTFKSDTGVIFDLYNEPHDITWAQWLSGGATQTNYLSDASGTLAFSWTTAGMQELLNAVRATGATNVCVANGIGWANALGQDEYDTTGNPSLGWLSHKPTDATGNLMAGCHLYSGQPYSSIPATADQPFSTTAAAAVLTVAASYPVLIGEYGDKVGSLIPYAPALLEWAERNGLSHAAWTFNNFGDPENVLLTAYNASTQPYEVVPNAGEGAFVLPYIRARRRITIPNTNISAGQPIFASSSTGSAVTRITQSNWDGNDWRSSGYPASVSLDLSAVTASKRTNIALAMSNSNYQGDSSTFVSPTYSAWSDYKIQGNAGAGGGSVPGSGWVDILSVTGNKQRSRSHRLLFAAAVGGTPYNWLRVLFTAGNSQNDPGNSDASLNLLDVSDVSAGNYSSWFMMGDSILSQTVRADGTGFGAAYKSRYSGFPALFEINGAPGYKASDFASGGSYNTQWLAYLNGTACQNVYIAFGTNDASPGVAATFDSNMRELINNCLSHGLIPWVPTIPWSTNSTRNTNATPLNAKIAQIYTDYGGVVFKGPDWWTFYQSGILTSDEIHPVDHYPEVAAELARVLGLRALPGASADNWTPPTIDLSA